MNSKLCKRLRRMAEFTSTFQSATQYETQYHRKEVWDRNTFTKRQIQVQRRTVGECTRLVYLQLKKEAH